MKMKPLAFLSTLARLLLLSSPLLAHHGYAAYNMQLTKSMKATITSVTRMNPHSQMTADVKDANGNVEHWIIEGGAKQRLNISRGR
jgi:hypothetical protein